MDFCKCSPALWTFRTGLSRGPGGCREGHLMSLLEKALMLLGSPPRATEIRCSDLCLNQMANFRHTGRHSGNRNGAAGTGQNKIYIRKQNSELVRAVPGYLGSS